MSLVILIAFGSMILITLINGDILFFRTHFNDQILPRLYSYTVFANPNIASAYGVMLFPVMFSLGMQKIID